MKIRNKILIYFSSIITVLTGIAFLIIYMYFSAHREEEFQQRQKQKILTTLYFLSEIRKTDSELIEAIDRLTINDLFDEKLLIFNAEKILIYSSIDDTQVLVSKKMLSQLNAQKRWIETKDGLYDVVGTYVEQNGKTYYGISKAYDTFGYSKLVLLRNILISTFISIIICVLVVSFFLSKRISKPLTDLADILGTYRLDQNPAPKSITTTTFEITYLNDQFNELVKRTHEAFAFQKQSIQLISHQLKTPITVLISELERIKSSDAATILKPELESQIIKTKSLADIINVLLEISKIKTGQYINRKEIRIDEIIFDCIDDLNKLYPNFNFEVNYFPQEIYIHKLIINTNEMLIKQAFQNLLNNCIVYSDNEKATIKIDCSDNSKLQIIITNTGKPVSADEQKYMFNHFFRGKNSWGKTGFGLGLVLTQKIITLNSGSIFYSNPLGNLNVIKITLPLS